MNTVLYQNLATCLIPLVGVAVNARLHTMSVKQRINLFLILELSRYYFCGATETYYINISLYISQRVI